MMSLQQFSGLWLEDEEDTETSITSTADQLLELMFSWMDQRELCAEQLRKLARELESLREKFIVSEGVCSSASVEEGAALLGAGATSAAAAPLAGVSGAECSGVGVTVPVAAKITERFSSSDTMKEAQMIEEKSNGTAEEIQKVLDQLKVEVMEVSSSADSEEVERRVVAEILTAVIRRSELMLDYQPLVFSAEGSGNMSSSQMLKPEVNVGLSRILTFFTHKLRGTETKRLFAERLNKHSSTRGEKTALKGGAVAVGGAVGLYFDLPEAINNWRELIENNHVTEASQSLTDTADVMLETCRTLRERFDDIRKMFDKTAERQQGDEEDEMTKYQREDEEDEEELCREKNTQQDCEEDPESLNKDNILSPKSERSENQELRAGTQHVNKHHDQTKQTGSDQQGDRERDQEDEERDREDEESDREDEERDREDEERDREDEESDREDEESDQEDEERDSEEETEDDERKQTGKKKKTKRQRETDQATIRAALLNVRSMNNKTSRISQLIRGNNLDVFLTTETWLQQRSADRVLREASPPNFSFYYHVREDGRGGGVAIQFSNELQGRQIYFSFITTFEYVATVLQHDWWNQPVLTINVYYPPGYRQQEFRVFLNEFQRLLDEVFSIYNSIIVTGDFNIWVDRTRRSFTDEFDHLLLINNLVQHVHEPTHERGHTLDLVITRNVAVPALVVRNDNISDHYTVYFITRPESRDTEEKTKENTDEDEQTKQFIQKEE